MRLYNIREGISAKDDTLPERFFNEKLNASPKKGVKINKKKFKSIIKMYYSMMGWNVRGIPKKSTLIDNHLEEFMYIIK